MEEKRRTGKMGFKFFNEKAICYKCESDSYSGWTGLRVICRSVDKGLVVVEKDCQSEKWRKFFLRGRELVGINDIDEINEEEIPTVNSLLNFAFMTCREVIVLYGDNEVNMRVVISYNNPRINFSK